MAPLLALLGACHRYTPATVDPRAGDAVRLHLTAPATQRLAPTLGMETVAVDGRLLAPPRDAFEISMTGTVKRGDTRAMPGTSPPLTIARLDVARVDTRRLDRRRTAGAVGIALLGGVAVKLLVNQVTEKAGGDDVGTTPPPPP